MKKHMNTTMSLLGDQSTEFDRVELINTQVNKNKKTQQEPAMFLVEELPF